jgi:beta-lactamase class D
MTFNRIAVWVALSALLSVSPASAEKLTICTAVADAETGKLLKQDGACDTRATAASTFKVAISLMGYDAGILKDAHTPALPFEKGYPDWIPAWRSTTDPSKWMKESVVWYSQQVTKALGRERFARYVREFRYGNQDVSGDPAKKNGLTHAWLGTSLEITPFEQLDFLQKIVQRKLPISAHAYETTSALTDLGVQPNGWRVHGKTGTGALKKSGAVTANSQFWGWFVGWATKGDRTIVFARLTKDTKRPSVPAGPAAREAVLRDLFSSPGEF